MQIESKKINDVSFEASATIAQDVIDTAEAKIAKKFAKEVKLDGFRAGKVPVGVVKKKYTKEIEQEAQTEILQGMLDDVLAENKLAMSDLVGEPTVSKFDKTETGVDVEIKVFTKPVVNVDGYKDLIPEYEKPAVESSEVDAQIEQMLKSVAPMVSVEEDRTIENGDFSVIDFEGFVEGTAFEGGKASNYSLEIGSASFIPGFEDGIIGMKKGDNKEITVTFPAEYQNDYLAGKESMFKVTLVDIQQKDLPGELDDETAKKLSPGQDDMTALKLIENTRNRLQADKLSGIYNNELKPKLIDALVSKIDFDIPQNIVDQEVNVAINNSLKDKTEDEVKEYTENEDKLKELKDSLYENAVNSVKLTFIVDELSKVEKVTVSDDEVAQTLYYEAIQMGQPPKDVIEYYEKQGLMPAVKMSLVEDKLFTKLLDTDKV